MNESNAVLAQRARAEDENAFAKLFGHHHSLVFSVCMRMLGHRQDAEDMTQETFSRLAQYFHRWDSSRPLEPWLVTIAGNRCRTLLQKRKKHQTLTPGIEPITQESINQNAAESLQEELELALLQIPEQQRLAFNLFHQRSMSYGEIAKEMGCPIGTVKTWVHRARTSVNMQLREREVVANAVEDVQ